MEKGQQKMSEDKFIPISKQSKRNKKKFHASKRRTWGSINPVTKKPPNPKAYNRRKNRKQGDGSSASFQFDSNALDFE